jgi:hypothetical protein
MSSLHGPQPRRTSQVASWVGGSRWERGPAVDRDIEDLTCRLQVQWVRDGAPVAEGWWVGSVSKDGLCSRTGRPGASEQVLSGSWSWVRRKSAILAQVQGTSMSCGSSLRVAPCPQDLRSQTSQDISVALVCLPRFQAGTVPGPSQATGLGLTCFWKFLTFS